MLNLRRHLATRSRQEQRLDWACAAGEVLPLRWVQEPRARRLRLIVQEDAIRLTVPPGVAEATARRFVREHEPWLLRHWGRRIPPPVALEWCFGGVEQLPLWGESASVRWETARVCRVDLDSEGLVFSGPAAASAASLQRALREFYAAQARAAVGQWLPRYLPDLPRAPSEFRLRPLRSLWGSLSPDGAVSLDLTLVLGPPAAFEYVLVHELCHLLQRNHGPRFWAAVTARCPSWRTQRDYLRSREGLALKSRWTTMFRSSP